MPSEKAETAHDWRIDPNIIAVWELPRLAVIAGDACFPSAKGLVMPISREDVIAGYLLILGREPESEAVIAWHQQRHDNLAALRRALLDSEEFRLALADILRRPPHLIIDRPMLVSYAQVLEDVVLWRALGHIERGFWIDVGAYHPVFDSVTKAFSERGWRGINIEPVAQWFAELVRDRPRDINLNIAAAQFDGAIEFYEIAETGLSTTVEKFAERAIEFERKRITVPCRRLSAICAEHADGDIHFLKIDVEGAERAVLEGCDFARFRPWIILVEAVEPRSAIPSHEAWQPILLAAGYEYALFDGLNRFYVADERRELKAALEFPADYYRRAAEMQTMRGA